jgi:Cd2+/Zn2+-exporting ATPase
MCCALAGKIPLTVGVVGHEGSTVVVVMNSLRLLFGGVKKLAVEEKAG